MSVKKEGPVHRYYYYSRSLMSGQPTLFLGLRCDYFSVGMYRVTPFPLRREGPLPVHNLHLPPPSCPLQSFSRSRGGLSIDTYDSVHAQTDDLWFCRRTEVLGGRLVNNECL